MNRLQVWRVELVDAAAEKPRRRVDVLAFNPAAARQLAEQENAGWVANIAKPVAGKS